MSLQKWMKVDHMMAAGLFSLVILGLVVPRKLLYIAPSRLYDMDVGDKIYR